MGMSTGWHDPNTSLSALDVLCLRIDKDIFFSLIVAPCDIGVLDLGIKLKKSWAVTRGKKRLLLSSPQRQRNRCFGVRNGRSITWTVQRYRWPRVNAPGLPLSEWTFERKNETKASYTIFIPQFLLFLEMENGPGNWLVIISHFYPLEIVHPFPWDGGPSEQKPISLLSLTEH